MPQNNKPSLADTNNLLKKQKSLKRLSSLLDDAITIPVLNIKLGWDAIIGLVPVIGDIAGAIISLYIVGQALSLGLPVTKIARMLINIGIELLIGIIPVFGDLFDIGWRANKKNYDIIDQHIEKQLQQQKPPPTHNIPTPARDATPLFSLPIIAIFLLCLAVAYLGYPYIIDLKSQCANGLVIWGITLC